LKEKWGKGYTRLNHLFPFGLTLLDFRFTFIAYALASKEPLILKG
jgi:hypothetical protein